MKVGIDAFGCDHGQSGTGAYLLNFIKNIPQELPFDIELFGLEIDRYTFTGDSEIPFMKDLWDSIDRMERWI